jgi:hypothetical protein
MVLSWEAPGAREKFLTEIGLRQNVIHKIIEIIIDLNFDS